MPDHSSGPAFTHGRDRPLVLRGKPGAIDGRATRQKPKDLRMARDQSTKNGWVTDWGLVIVAWLLVSLPLAWGVLMSLKKAAQLFASG